ncbi:MAG: glycosyltransferase family 2 protein [Candidatus Hydrogenedentes bacterium]|nr:glycosyltransferase family 2 protein [Candidatus Hydrogenedentota bacterium]
MSTPEEKGGCKISIVIPCYNEVENIPILLERLDNTIKQLVTRDLDTIECIIVNDGSTDNTKETLEKLLPQYSYLKPIHLEKNRGQSYALWRGLKSSKGEVIVILDGDLQNDPNDIPRILKELELADFVQGYRENRQDTWLRSWVSKQANRILRITLDMPVRDTGCALKAMKRDCLDFILPFNGSHRFYAFLVHTAGFIVKEIPVQHHSRTLGKSKYNIRNRLFRTLFDLLGLYWWKKRSLQR